VLCANREDEAARLAHEPWVRSLTFDLPPGALVEPFTDGRRRVGQALLVADTRKDLDQRVAELRQTLAVTANQTGIKTIMMNIWQMLRDRRNRRHIYNQPDFWNRKAQALKGHAVSMWPNNHLNDLYHAELLQLLEPELTNLHGQEVP